MAKKQQINLNSHFYTERQVRGIKRHKMVRLRAKTSGSTPSRIIKLPPSKPN